MRRILIDNIVGEWIDPVNCKEYHFAVDDGKNMVTIINQVSGKTNVSEFKILDEKGQFPQVELEQFLCDVWEYSSSSITLNKMGFIFTITKK